MVTSSCTALIVLLVFTLLTPAAGLLIQERATLQRLPPLSHRLCMQSSPHGSFVEDCHSRRNVLQKVLFSFAATIGVSTPVSAVEQDRTSSSNNGVVSTDRVADILREIPTFTLVDRKGIPFMVVGEDAKVTGYFFTEYDEAKRILDLATKSAEKELRKAMQDPEQKKLLDGATNPWKDARISTVPLDFAVTLASKSSYAKQSLGGNYFQVAPSEVDVDAALALTGKSDLAEGKVPLFYYKDFGIEQSDKTISPLFFRKADLEAAYRRYGGNDSSNGKSKDTPSPLVTELFAVLAEMVKPGGKDDGLSKLAFIAPSDSEKRAKECIRRGGQDPPFVLGKRNIVL